MEAQQDINDQICSQHAKLDLLKKAHVIEEQDRQRAVRVASRRNEEASRIRAKNANLSKTTHAEMMFRREETERRDLMAKLKKYANELGLSSMSDVLDSFDGIF